MHTRCREASQWPAWLISSSRRSRWARAVAIRSVSELIDRIDGRGTIRLAGAPRVAACLCAQLAEFVLQFGLTRPPQRERQGERVLQDADPLLVRLIGQRGQASHGERIDGVALLQQLLQLLVLEDQPLQRLEPGVQLLAERRVLHPPRLRREALGQPASRTTRRLRAATANFHETNESIDGRYACLHRLGAERRMLQRHIKVAQLVVRSADRLAHAGACIGGAVAGVEHPVTGAQRVQLSEDALLDERKQSLLFAQLVELRLKASQFLAGHAPQLTSEARQALGPG